MQVVVFPVPDGMTAEEAWVEILVFGRLQEGRSVEPDGTGGYWAVMEITDDEVVAW